ncbi:LysE family translocator [Endozoicomonas acroporae]|uniref:LysE family translocator n=1 Tax=Endozoicomonas acroporae TaxID=1701104 RepID=UPI0013D2FF76|nr:LysE family translocator [Endozoicomonas acroporae]
MNEIEILWLPLVTFALSSSITPGPNNIMLAASGVNYGFTRSIPHMLGVSIGFFILFLGVAFGLGSVFERYPQLQTGLKYIGSMYLLWLAWKIATAASVSEQADSKRPMTFLQAISFQFVNVKALMMAISSAVVFTLPGDNYTLSVLLVGVIFSLINLPCCSVWVVFGSGLRRFLKNEQSLRAFNWSLASLTAASVALFYV